MTGRNNKSADLVQIRAKLEADAGEHFWRGLGELAGSQDYQDSLDHEFPRDPAKEPGAVSRRDILKLMGASAAFAGLTACTKLPTEKIVPYVNPPEEIIPGKPLFYATTMQFGGFGTGLVVESHMGSPTKVEGNPDHPASLGASDVFAQASVLTLYDPDRSKVVISRGQIASWSDFLNAAAQPRQHHLARQGAGLRILTETITSPTLADQLHALLEQFPAAKWHQYEPCGRDAAREGARLAFGEYVNTVYRFDRADVVLSLDSDFLCSGPGAVRYARDFADKRRVTGPESAMNRLYVVESMLSNTGAMADHRLRLRSSDVEAFARTVAAAVKGAPLAAVPTGVPTDWIPALVRDLERQRGSSIVIAGDQQPPAVHAVAHALNDALGNAGKTVVYMAPVEANPVDQMQSLRDLVTDIAAGLVDTLVILGGNPVYDAPADLDFRDLLLKVPLRIHLGLYDNETAELCHWHVPEAHYLEAWGDARAYDGTASVIQPLIAPLYDGHSAHELLTVLLGQPGRTSHDIVRDYWQGQKLVKDEEFEAAWESWLEKGVIPGTALPPRPASLKTGAEAGTNLPRVQPSVSRGLEVVFRPDPSIWDGRFANNGWLQELPKPFTKLTWDNAVMISPVTAESLGLETEDVVELRSQGRSVQAPVWVMPGHADESVTVYLGFGRRRAGGIGTGVGFNAYALRTSDKPWLVSGVQLSKTGAGHHLVTTEIHHAIRQEGEKVEEESVTAFKRDLVRAATLDEFRKNPEFARDPEEEKSRALTLYPNYSYKQGYAWGMSIDLNCCTGCNACVIACQSENNVPVVGKAEVDASRDMQWIRIDTYYRGDLDHPEAYNEVVMCMQCENAPCELVCPVGATVHSPEGLNEMIYNRCVGTRYCSNNCPYKVRRFNFKLYSDWTTPSLYGLRNPNVTVRSRGVMEKCTYCIQRINAKKIQAELEDREVRDGEIVTACQQSCPTQALVFGNINDPNSRVSKLKARSRDYSLLLDLNTRPRTTYLAKLTNPNPEIKE